jgi:hypothetical protein
MRDKASAPRSEVEASELPPQCWQRDLAERFLPVLVMFPEVERNSLDEGEVDFHPRDIRFVLGSVSQYPKERRKVAVLAWSDSFARSWPVPVLTITLVFYIVWLVRLLLPDEWWMSQTWISYGNATLLAYFFLLSAAALRQVGRAWAIAVSVLSIVGQLVVLEAFMDFGWEFYLTLILLMILTSRVWLELSGSRASPDGLLTSLSERRQEIRKWKRLSRQLKVRIRLDPAVLSEAFRALYARLQQRLSPQESQTYLQFLEGKPRNVGVHRKAYVKLREQYPNEYPVTTYARVERGEGEYQDIVAIQYWFAYYYNAWANNHEMDWEQVTVFVYLPSTCTDVKKAVPGACSFSAHNGGTVVPWVDVHKSEDGLRPTIYVARGSHANYARPGRHRPGITVGGLRFTRKDLALLTGSDGEYLDIAPRPESGVTLEAIELVYISEGAFDESEQVWIHRHVGKHSNDVYGVCKWDLRWLNLGGIWGSPGGILGGDSSPTSPPNQKAWDDPFVWLEECDPYTEQPAKAILQQGFFDSAYSSSMLEK